MPTDYDFARLQLAKSPPFSLVAVPNVLQGPARGIARNNASTLGFPRFLGHVVQGDFVFVSVVTCPG